MENDGPRFICYECGAVVSKDDVARLVLAMESARPLVRIAVASTNFRDSRRYWPSGADFAGRASVRGRKRDGLLMSKWRRT